MKSAQDYRPGVGIYLYNSVGKVFVGKRIDNTSEAWQMPQGGIDAGETAIDAMYRELHEEIGVATQHVELKQEIDEWLYYDLPAHLVPILWNGRYKGQCQKWFALKFLGSDADININAHTPPEFNEWKWINPAELTTLIVDFKRDLYADILKRLHHITRDYS
jgi:putative (di)nucleoside polyphosphate hydrolase